ncbi:YcdB/YcdC domain-containing protein [Bacillus sp. FJAT-22090]|uniref:YcdB/YcdC domain-containing protein n=1 Tax=Bacillus sp. FJAT-22090 TaxID=1581038 RepID=UPI0011AA3C2E|nr:S-layer homology domain-containing protein [Bacillus sp. FJAT-22090]
MNFKKVGTILTSSVLTFGMFSSMASAAGPVNEQQVQIQIAATDAVFTKNDLIKKFHELFPNKFTFLTNSDFHMSGAHIYTEDDTVRYDLSFNKMVEGKRLSGSVMFVGDKLEIEQFYFQPLIEKDALFPAKVSKEEAKKIADDFVKKFINGEEYKPETNPYNYFPQQILTEPIRYSFSYARTKDQVSIADQRIEISVLGNGEVVNFYKIPTKVEASTFDDAKQVKDKKEILEKVKENLLVDLQYQIDMDYQTGERSVKLVYQPTTKVQGVNASSGKWLTGKGYTDDVPKQTKIEKLSANPLPPKQNGITVEEAKKIAEKFLSVKSDKVKLSIESISEIENYNGQPVISIQYMYQYKNGGSGTNLLINKQTGEVIQYHDMTGHILDEIGEKPKEEKAISQEEALAQATKYVKEWIPSYLHNYAMPVEEPYYDDRLGTYQFYFPRIVNGIIVIGDQINVGIASDGSLTSLNVDYQEVEKWPAIDKVISKEAATAKLKDSLSLKLTYMKKDYNQENHHYDLVYLPVYNEEAFTYLDANTGEWNSLNGMKVSPVISHPWAEEELNYLINAKVLDIKDPKKFNGDASISKGEALKVIMNSLTYFYAGYYGEREESKQTFDNIDSKHPLYQPIERAVEMGIIQPTSKNFDVDSSIKREELAAWYIRVLGLEQAAKHSDIYKLGFADASKVKKEYTGYVALASSLGILEPDKNNFGPAREVTYAELAVSTIRLAHEMSEKRNGMGYY